MGSVSYKTKKNPIETAMEIPDPSTPAGCLFLQSHLSSRSYISGFFPSHNDAKVFNAMRAEPVDKENYYEVVRWFRHIKSFPAEERKTMPDFEGGEVLVLRDAAAAAKKEEEVWWMLSYYF